jgi:hypothetical protein
MATKTILQRLGKQATLLTLCAALAPPALGADEDGKPRRNGDQPGAKREGGDQPGARREGGDQPGARREGGDQPGARREGGDQPGRRTGGDKAGADRPEGRGDQPGTKRDGDKPGQKAEGKGDQPKPDGGDQRRGYDKLRMGPNGLPLPADHSKTVEAKKTLDEAKTQLTQALDASTAPSAAALDNELWKQDDYKQAMLELRRTQADYDAVRRPIFDALRMDTYYRELERKQTEVDKIMHSLILTGRGSFDWLLPQAMAALDVRNRMTREQIVALTQAPEVEDARQRMLRAAAKVKAIKTGKVAQSTSPDNLRAAKAETEAARDRVRTAQTAYNSALAEEAEYEKLRSDYIAEMRRTGRAPGN